MHQGLQTIRHFVPSLCVLKFMDSDKETIETDCDKSYADVVNCLKSSPPRLDNSWWSKFQDQGEEEAMRIALQHSIQTVQVWSCLYITLLVLSWKGNKVKRIFELQDFDDSEDNGTRATVRPLFWKPSFHFKCLIKVYFKLLRNLTCWYPFINSGHWQQPQNCNSWVSRIQRKPIT